MQPYCKSTFDYVFLLLIYIYMDICAYRNKYIYTHVYIYILIYIYIYKYIERERERERDRERGAEMHGSRRFNPQLDVRRGKQVQFPKNTSSTKLHKHSLRRLGLAQLSLAINIVYVSSTSPAE